MPKSKRGPALFEVYDKGRHDDALHREDCLSQFARRSPARESASAFKSTLSSLARSISGGTSDDDPDRPESTESSSSVAVDGGRLHVALTSRGAGLVAFGLLLAAVAVFVMGSWYGRQSGFADGEKHARLSIQGKAVDEIAVARQSKPVEGLFDGIGPAAPIARASSPQAQPQPQARLPRPATTLTARRTARATWVKGNTYVVVQSFSGSAQQDAIRAQEYLAQHGVAAEVFGSPSRGYRLIATTGFNCKDATQEKLSNKFIKRIGKIGEAYFKSGGRYKLEGYFATLTSDTW